nr:hypothetical protein [Tanacetum cinerariifolium]
MHGKYKQEFGSFIGPTSAVAAILPSTARHGCVSCWKRRRCCYCGGCGGVNSRVVGVAVEVVADVVAVVLVVTVVASVEVVSAGGSDNGVRERVVHVDGPYRSGYEEHFEVRRKISPKKLFGGGRPAAGGRSRRSWKMHQGKNHLPL